MAAKDMRPAWRQRQVTALEKKILSNTKYLKRGDRARLAQLLLNTDSHAWAEEEQEARSTSVNT